MVAGRLSNMFVLVVVLILGAFLYEGGFDIATKANSFSDRMKSSGVIVTDTGPDGTKIRFHLGKVNYENVVIDGESRQKPFFDQSQLYGEVGAPTVPVLRKLIAMPDCEYIDIDYDVISESSLSGINVFPCPRFERDAFENPIEVYDEDQSIYTKNEYFPDNLVRLVKIGYLRGQRLGLIEIAPVRYNPVQKRLQIIDEITIDIRTVNPTGDVFKYTGPMSGVLSTVVVNNQYVGISPASGLNVPLMTSGNGGYKWCGGNTVTSVADSVVAFEADYLIIAAEEIATSSADSALVEQLADHRADYNGFNVAIVRIDQIHSSPNTTTTPDSIRTLIKTVFDSESAAHMGDSKLGFVLLLGDAWNPDGSVLIPSYHGFPEVTGNERTDASDTYYTLLGDDPHTDPFPDLFLGRLPVDSDDNDWELDNVVTKTIDYEPLPSNADWPDKILMFSGSYATQNWNDDFCDFVKNNVIPGSKDVDELHLWIDCSSHRDCSEAIADSLTKGYWVVTGLGHGNPYYFKDTFFATHYDVLQDSIPVVFSFFGCEIGRFDLNPDSTTTFCSELGGCTSESVDTLNLKCYKPESPLDNCDCMAERVVLQENGAVAAFAYTRLQEEHDAKFDYYNFYKALFMENASTLGEVLLGTKLLNVSAEATLYSYTLFGDPALNVKWTDVANDTIDVAVAQSGITGRNNTVYLDSNSSDYLKFTVKNIASNVAEDVTVEIWSGDPDDSLSTRLDSVVIDEIAAYGAVTDSISVSFDPGMCDIYVRLDPEDSIDEPDEDNNMASRTFHVLPYNGSSFPIRTNTRYHLAVTIADVTDDLGEEVIVCSWY